MGVDRLFLSVGAMKAGTTFLFNVFNMHPQIYFTPEKELHFFAETDGTSQKLRKPLVSNAFGIFAADRRGPRNILSNEFRRHRLSMVMHNRFSRLTDAEQVREIVRWYADRYMTNPVDDAWFDRVFTAAGDRYAADFSNYYALLDSQGWNHVKSLTRHLRVIYTLRHPIERLWSHIKFQYIQSGRRADLERFGLRDLETILADGAISSHARYGDIVESLKSNLADEQLHLVVFEDVQTDFATTIRQIEDFLGITHHAYRGIDPSHKANATEAIEIPSALRERMRQAVHPQLQKLKALGVAFPDAYWE